ncbi:MAG: ComEC/Rec2 family competence protein [Dehalococcoidales bacterium]|nr:ComEC/Rec2 family competence protein [Dehalococcoidales bacterium]
MITLGAIIAVWPIVINYFHIISFTAPFTTLFALPALPVIIFAGALAGGLGLIALPVAQIIAWLVWLSLSYILLIVNIFASIPLSFLNIYAIPKSIIWIYYLLLAIILWLNSHRRQASTLTSKILSSVKPNINQSTKFFSILPSKWIFTPLLAVSILVSFSAVTMPDNNLHVSILNVGNGDAILIQKGNRQILIDGGPSPQAIALELGKKLPFWDRTVDLIILTHPESDHITGLIEVLNRYNVKQVLYPDLDFNSDLYNEWLRLIEEKKIKCSLAQSGQQINLDKAIIKIINPQIPHLSKTQSDVNNNAAVLRITIGKISFLLTADIMWETEYNLIADGSNLTSTVLKVAHHGSDTSTTEEFLAAVNPQIAVISVGTDNKFNHPKPEVIKRLEDKLGPENIYRSDKQSTIEFITDGEKLWLKTK